MQADMYSRRMLSPFRGMLQVIEVPGGIAESTDGLDWKLYVADESIVSHTGLSEVRYGSWRLGRGGERSRIRGTCAAAVIEEIGAELVAVLEQHAEDAPFSPRDCCELWLLEARSGRPLVLLESELAGAERGPATDPRWLPGAAARTDFESSHGSADTLAAGLAFAAGRQARAVWLRRDGRGGGTDDEGGHWPADWFPPLFIRTRWADAVLRALTADFIAWQAPWLLQLGHLDDATRSELEAAAWSRPLVTSEICRLYPRVIDERGLVSARVRARLMGDQARAARPLEPFYPFVNE